MKIDMPPKVKTSGWLVGWWNVQIKKQTTTKETTLLASARIYFCQPTNLIIKC